MAKRHHYIPVTYLRQFSDFDGQLYLHRKDEPMRVFRAQPQATGFERYYYSQFSDDGTRDDDRLELLFSEVETKWPSIVDAFQSRKGQFANAHHLITFLALMRVRGPAFRDSIELQNAEMVRAQARILQITGKLPPAPHGYENLLEEIDIAIDPQVSLVFMARIIKYVGQIFASLNYEVIHNKTEIPFLTSDNPVMYFNPLIPDSRMLPYTVRSGAEPIELLFPVTPFMMLRGQSGLTNPVVGHVDICDRQWVKRVNRLSSRFGYRAVFASQSGFEDLIKRHASVSPVVQFSQIPAVNGGIFTLSQFVFGPRPKKPKW